MKDQSVFLHEKEFEMFLKRKEIKGAINRLSEKINHDYKDRELVIIGVLDGAFMFLADLLKKLDLKVSLELVKVKSYEGEQNVGKIKKLIGLTYGLANQSILIVEDIIDTGNTLSYLLELIEEQNPASVKVATLLLKKEVFKDRFPIHYYGIAIPNRFVVGYGMDYDGHGRQLKHIYASKESF